MNYLWYSGATDVTGRALAEALGIEGTREKPRLRRGDVLIGWGTKVNEDINLPNGITVYNHPNAIRTNRNKLKALEIMYQDNNINGVIAKFAKSDEIIAKIRNNELKLPLIGRTKYHQGGKGLWVCLTKTHVKMAIRDGAAYFQEYIDIDTEYRLHVAFGEVIYAVKKVANNNITHWIEQRKDKILDYAAKNNWNLDDDTVDKVLTIISREVVLPDQVVRSNRRGWTFKSVRLNNISRRLKEIAVNAVLAVGLDFGAVDCAKGVNNRYYVIEVNSGPGLQRTAFDKYVEAFNNQLNNVRPQRNIQAVGAEIIEEHNQHLDDEGLVRIIRNVRNDEEARVVINLIMGRHNG